MYTGIGVDSPKKTRPKTSAACEKVSGLSSYRTTANDKIWVITEADRLHTVAPRRVLIPRKTIGPPQWPQQQTKCSPERCP
jgi:hypothetical protein